MTTEKIDLNKGEKMEPKAGSTIKNFVKVFVLSFGFLFSLNAFSVGDLISCTSDDNLNEYNELHQLIKKSSNIALVYNLAITSLCLGKTNEGMSHLQKASDSGHIAATYLLALYYEHNQTFDSSKFRSNVQDLNNAIHYYTKAAQRIGSLKNYPKGATADMEYIESVDYTSYLIFKNLPDLYLTGYFLAIEDITNNNTEVFYTDTLDVLSNIRATAIMCVERPSLSVWKGKRDMIYKAQQIKCEALLRFAEAVYPLEQQRIQIAQHCRVPSNKCTEHQEIVAQIDQFIDRMFNQMNSAPRIQ